MQQDNQEIAEEVQQVLQQEDQGILLEDVPNEQSSPLNEAVKEKDIAGNTSESSHQAEAFSDAFQSSPPLDAPEQEIGADPSYQYQSEEQENYEMPKSTAEMAADALLGSVNNYIGVGAGFFIRIRKHKDFYEFEEIIRIVDDQNDRNIQRIKFDEEDLALLKPILIQVIQKRAKKLTPEQQLLSVLLSIMVKKAQVVMEIRAENELLIDRILDIIREEKGVEVAESQEDHESHEPVSEEAETEVIHTMTIDDQEESAFESQVLEVSTPDESIAEKDE